MVVPDVHAFFWCKDSLVQRFWRSVSVFWPGFSMSAIFRLCLYDSDIDTDVTGPSALRNYVHALMECVPGRRHFCALSVKFMLKIFKILLYCNRPSLKF